MSEEINPRHERFAALYHRYGNATRAYGEAAEIPALESGYFPSWCAVEGHRFLRNPNVRDELSRLRGESAALTSMDVAEVDDWLTGVINTPVGEIDEFSPYCEEVTREYRKDPGEDGERYEVVKIKSASKLGAAKELIRRKGMAAAQEVKISADGEVCEMLRGLMGAREK